MDYAKFLAELAALSRKGTIAYQKIVFLVECETISPIRTCWTSGTGWYTKNLDYTMEISNVLAKMGIEHEIKNDALRGGKPGNHIILTSLGLARIQQARDERQLQLAPQRAIQDANEAVRVTELTHKAYEHDANLARAKQFAENHPEIHYEYELLVRTPTNSKQRTAFFGKVSWDNHLNVKGWELRDIYFNRYGLVRPTLH